MKPYFIPFTLAKTLNMKKLSTALFALLFGGLLSAQNVGINTNTPTATLDVNGSVKVNSLSGSSTQMVVADLNGNLSTQPIPGLSAEISDADGDTKIMVEATPDNDVILFDAGGSPMMNLGPNAAGIPTLGLSNVGGNLLVGTQAGSGLTPAGINNTLVGQGAGSNGTIGFLNTFIGFEAGFFTDSTGDNTFVGAFAGRENRTGGENAFFGSFAGFDNTTGVRNTYIGRYSGQLGTTGALNTYLGYGTGSTNLTGSGNVFLGYSAGRDELGSNRLYIANSSTTSPLLYGEFDNNILRVNGGLQVDQNTGGRMLLLNRDTWTHSSGLQDFGDGGDYIMMASREGSGESAGMYGDGDHLTFWSPGDGAPGQPSALAYFLDEDFFDATDTDPFNNSALKVYLNTAGVWQVSDERKKANIQPMANAIEKVQSLHGYTYEFLPNQQEIAKGDQPMPAAGVMAQDLQQVLPEAVNETQNGEYFVNYAAIIPLLIEAIKSQQTQIEQLESQIQALTAD